MEKSQYTISAIVDSYLIGKQDSNHLYPLYLHYALDGLREMHMDFAQEVKTDLFILNDYRAIDLPTDYVDFVKVAIKSGERLFVIGLASDLSRLRDKDECGSTIANRAQLGQDKPTGTAMAELGGYYLNNYNGGSLLAFMDQLPHKGYFTILKEYGQIQFDSALPAGCEVYMEYISDGFNPNGASFVHPYAYRYIKAYIENERVANDDSMSQAIKFEKSQSLYFERKKANMRIKLSGLNPIDIINSSRAGYSLLNKV